MDKFDFERPDLYFDWLSGMCFYMYRSDLELMHKKLDACLKEAMIAETKFTLSNYWRMFGHYYYAKCPDYLELLKGAV